MRIENADEEQLIVADEQLSSLEDVVRIMPTAQYLNVAMKELRCLDISHNDVESLQEVAALSNLLVLKCSSNQVTDLSWIAGLTQLEELWFRDNRIESAQVAHLQKLTALQTLVIHPNPCTERDDYVLTILKMIPWLQRVDIVVVTEELRVEARHAEERVTLDSGATDCSLFSLSGRSDDLTTSEKSTVSTLVTPSLVQLGNPSQLKKKMTAEDFMRAFPVQDFIPLSTTNGESAAVLDNQPKEEMGVSDLKMSSPTEIEIKEDNQDENGRSLIGNESGLEGQLCPLNPIVDTHSPIGATSALLDSVLTLPTFDGNSFLRKKNKLKSRLAGGSKSKVTTKLKAAVEPPNSLPPSRQDEEYHVTYPNSTVTAIHVRYDGSAIARWPSSTVAVSIDFEPDRNGYRVYAAHKDGQLALSFDPAGVGFLNAYPSGKTLISTTSDGSGFLFDANSGAIVRQWDIHGKLRDGACQCVDSLGDEPDGSLLCRLSGNLAVGVQLTSSREAATTERAGEVKESLNPVLLHIYFGAAPGVRHVFANRANVAAPSYCDACNYALGKILFKDDATKSTKTKKTPPVEHMDLLSSIRAAVAGL